MDTVLDVIVGKISCPILSLHIVRIRKGKAECQILKERYARRAYIDRTFRRIWLQAAGDTSIFFMRSSTLLTASSSSGRFTFLGGLRGQLSHFSCPQFPQIASLSLKVVLHFSHCHLTCVRMGFISRMPKGNVVWVSPG